MIKNIIMLFVAIQLVHATSFRNIAGLIGTHTSANLSKNALDEDSSQEYDSSTHQMRESYVSGIIRNLDPTRRFIGFSQNNTALRSKNYTSDHSSGRTRGHGLGRRINARIAQNYNNVPIRNSGSAALITVSVNQAILQGEAPASADTTSPTTTATTSPTTTATTSPTTTATTVPTTTVTTTISISETVTSSVTETSTSVVLTTSTSTVLETTTVTATP